MTVIGICGGSGSGKGAVCSIFLSLGIPSIDTDAVYHELTSWQSPCLKELMAEFGAQVGNGGRLNRTLLRELVFTPPFVKEKQSRLNEITHKYVIEEVERLLCEYEKNGARGVIIDAPLLIESGIYKRCDHVIAVTANREVRLARIMLRDGITLVQAEKRIDSQLPDTTLREYADTVIENDGTLDELSRTVKLVYEKIFE